MVTPDRKTRLDFKFSLNISYQKWNIEMIPFSQFVVESMEKARLLVHAAKLAHIDDKLRFHKQAVLDSLTNQERLYHEQIIKKHTEFRKKLEKTDSA